MNDIVIPRRFADDPKFAAEWRKMLSGQVYDAVYEPFITLLKETRRKIREYNDALPDDDVTLTRLAKEILGALHGKLQFHCARRRTRHHRRQRFHRSQRLNLHRLPPHRPRGACQGYPVGTPRHHRRQRLDRGRHHHPPRRNNRRRRHHRCRLGSDPRHPLRHHCRRQPLPPRPLTLIHCRLIGWFSDDNTRACR